MRPLRRVGVPAALRGHDDGAGGRDDIHQRLDYRHRSPTDPAERAERRVRDQRHTRLHAKLPQVFGEAQARARRRGIVYNVFFAHRLIVSRVRLPGP